MQRQTRKNRNVTPNEQYCNIFTSYFLFYFSRSSEFYNPHTDMTSYYYLHKAVHSCRLNVHLQPMLQANFGHSFLFFFSEPRTNLLLVSSTHLRCSVSWFGVLYNDGKWPPRCSAHDKWSFAVADKSFPPRPASLFLLYSIIDLFFYSLFLFFFFLLFFYIAPGLRFIFCAAVHRVFSRDTRLWSNLMIYGFGQRF